MGWVGCVALLILFFYSNYPEKIKKLECKVKKLERKQRGTENMSKIINELVGKTCDITMIETEDYENALIIDADAEWIKIEWLDKKKEKTISIIRVDDIESLEEVI